MQALTTHGQSPRQKQYIPTHTPMTQNTDVSQGCHTASSMLSCLTHGLTLSALLSIIARDPAPDYVVRRARLLRRAHVNRATLADALVTSSLVAGLGVGRPEKKKKNLLYAFAWSGPSRRGRRARRLRDATRVSVRARRQQKSAQCSRHQIISPGAHQCSET